MRWWLLSLVSLSVGKEDSLVKKGMLLMDVRVNIFHHPKLMAIINGAERMKSLEA